MLPSAPSRGSRPVWVPPTFDAAERRRLKWWLWLAVVAMVVIGVALVYVGEPMTADGGENVVAFELAGTGDRAAEIMDGWGPDGRDAAVWVHYLDFVWLVSYGAVLVLGSVLVAEMARDRGWRDVQRLGWLAAGLSLVAALMDVVENSMLLWQLDNRASNVAARVAQIAASVKFVFVALAILYLVVAGVACFFRRPAAERPAADEGQPVTINPPGS